MATEFDDVLKQLINEVALSRGDVKLSSGDASDRYIDMRKVTLHSYGALLVGYVLRAMTRNMKIKAIGGPATAAIPIVTAAVISSACDGCRVEGFYTRSETKEHGLKQQIEGYAIQPDDRVVMVEDVTTSGTSLYKATLIAREAGAVVLEAISLVDRGKQAAQLDWGDTVFRSVLTIDDLDWSKV